MPLKQMKLSSIRMLCPFLNSFSSKIAIENKNDAKLESLDDISQDVSVSVLKEFWKQKATF